MMALWMPMPKVCAAPTSPGKGSPLNLPYKRVSKHFRNKPKQMNTIKVWRNMSTNMIHYQSPKVKLNPAWPCCTATSDRHTEGETPNKPTENIHKETPKSPMFLLSTRTPAVNQPRRSLLFSKGSDFRKQAAVFSIVRFCCG